MPGHSRNRGWETPTYLFLAVANLAIGCFLIYASPSEVIQADAEQYYEIAKALVGKGGELSYTRTAWGYPMFLVLTGLPWTRWPVIAQVLQVCMVSAIPYFVGSSLRQLGAASWLAISAAILSFLTLPTVFSIALLTDSCSEFLLYLAIWQLARALVHVAGTATEGAIRGRRWWKPAIGVGALFFLGYLVRQANGFLGFVGLGAGVAVTGNAGRGVILRAIGVLIVLVLAWVPVQKGWAAWSEARAKRMFQTDGGWAGFSFFHNIYSAGPIFVGHPVVKAENGQCSALIYESVERNDPAAKDKIFTVTDATNVITIWKSVEGDFGPPKMDRIFWCAAFEAVYAEPKSLLYIYEGIVSFFLFDDVVYDKGTRQSWPSADYTTLSGLMWAWALFAGEIIKVIALLVALATLVPTWQRGGSQRAFAVMLWAMVLYLAAVHVIFASANWRYVTPVIPSLVLLAGLGLDALRKPVGYAQPLRETGSPA
jgi:hypothetical protein